MQKWLNNNTHCAEESLAHENSQAPMEIAKIIALTAIKRLPSMTGR